MSTKDETASSNQSGSNDFVKKLFQMLQEADYKGVVRWTDAGDSFVVINTNEFTKEILPRHFKHSNFASFVRQLNKYDFHKVKVPNEEKQTYPYGEDAWEFKHHDFRINDRDLLDNIKRKGPTTKKTPSLPGFSHNGSNTVIAGYEPVHHTQAQVDRLAEDLLQAVADNKVLREDIAVLQTKYQTLIDNIVAIKNFDERYYNLMGVLVACLTQAGIKMPPLDFPNPNLMNIQQPPPQRPLMAASPQVPAHGRSLSGTYPHMGQPFLPQAPVPPLVHASPPGGEQVTPRSPPLASTLASPTVKPELDSSITTTNIPNPKFHVLLVEDDNVCIQLCRKFLVKYGCQVTVVTDGLRAINTVNTTKYDLVLMDIVMPNLDGATATSVIRSFDTKTPIIAMTGNIDDSDLANYLENGMSDILAKPFNKTDLYYILSRYLLTETDPVPVAPPTAAEPPQAPETEVIVQETVLVEDPALKRQRLA